MNWCHSTEAKMPKRLAFLGCALGLIFIGPACAQALSAAAPPLPTPPQTLLAPIPGHIRPSVYLTPAPPSPADFHLREVQELQRRYGIHAAQNPVNQAVTLATDSLGWRDHQALMTISSYAQVIQTAAQKENLNPAVLAAILFDEIRHQKPTEAVMTQLGLAQTLGLAQISLRELVMQGFFDTDLRQLHAQGHFDVALQDLQATGRLASNKNFRKISLKELHTYLLPPQILAYLPAELIEKGQAALLDPHENIRILARQLARVRQQQGISAQQRFENLDKFAVAHSLARVVIFHNGRMDYAHKILNTLRLPQLEVALSGCYHARHRGTEAVELEPKPALGAQSTYQTRYLPWLNKG
jgi:hypothetical protein